MSKRKTNITPEDIRGYYQDSEGRIRKLVACEYEPHATMKTIVDGVGLEETKPISGFKDFVRLKPVVPRTRKVAEIKTRETRSDAGTHHKSQQKTESEIADKRKENLIIHTPTGIGDDTNYIVSIAGSRVTSPESAGLRAAIVTALAEFGGEIPDCLSADKRELLQNVLGIEVLDPRD